MQSTLPSPAVGLLLAAGLGGPLIICLSSLSHLTAHPPAFSHPTAAHIHAHSSIDQALDWRRYLLDGEELRWAYTDFLIRAGPDIRPSSIAERAMSPGLAGTSPAPRLHEGGQMLAIQQATTCRASCRLKLMERKHRVPVYYTHSARLSPTRLTLLPQLGMTR